MVKPHRKLPLSVYPQRFFKVFLPDQSSQRMKLPTAFLKIFNGMIPFKSTIISPTKSSWPVLLEKVSDNLYFHHGWEQFVQHNSLEFGDFLVFSYDGNTIFHVKIYGRNGCEKESKHPTRKHYGVSFPELNQIVEKRDFELLECISTREDFEGRNSALKEASEFKSNFPFFKIVMQPSYLAQGNMNIPASFIKRHMIRDTRGATLIYSDKSWPVKVNRSAGQSICKFASGSVIFSRDNALKVGDVCIFELVNRSNDCVFKVSIFRCSY